MPTPLLSFRTIAGPLLGKLEGLTQASIVIASVGFRYRSGRNYNAGIRAGIKAECLAYLATSEGCAALKRAVMAALDVTCVAITWPPGDHAGRWRCASQRDVDCAHHAVSQCAAQK